MVGNGGIFTENIDEVILGLLKLEDGGAVTYQTYYDRIKKKLMMARMGGSELPHEEDQLLRDELKRIRLIQDKTKVFKIKSKPRNNSTPPPPRSGSSGAPNSSAIVKAKKGKLGFQDLSIKRVNVTDVTQPTVRAPKDSIYDVLVRIDGLVESILQTLTQTSRLDARNRERERIRGEESGRKGRERRLESKGGLRPIVEAVKKIMAPFQSIWDRIVNFFVNVFFGKIAVSLFKWLADPENKGKVKSIIRFLKDWWPALVGGYLLFGTSFGKLIRTIIPSVTRFIFQLGKVAIPRLLTFVRNPFVAGTLLFTAGATIPALFPGNVNEKERKTRNAPGSKEEKIRKLEEQKANLNFFEKLQGKGSEIDEQIQYLKTGNTKSYGFAGGGYAGKLKKLLHRDQKPNSSSRLIRGPGGPTGDKIPAMLSDGEFVMSAAAVKKHGIQKLEAMNAAAGGTNTPRVINGRTYAAGGGFISKNSDESQNESRSDDISNIKKFIKNKLGFDVDRPSTWGSTLGKGNNTTSGPFKTPTGSIFTDPSGALSRIVGGGMRLPGIPSGGMRLPGIPSGGMRLPGIPSGGMRLPKNLSLPSGMRLPETPKMLDEILKNVDSAPFRDAAVAFIKHNIGGYGGPLSELDLSNESRLEIRKAIERAKKRTSTEIRKAEMKIAELESSGATKTLQGKIALATQRSFLNKLRKGIIRVQYTDYRDEKGGVSKDARNVKLILGQFWAHSRSKKEGGGYRIEDKYDFKNLTVKDAKTGKERDMTNDELWNNIVMDKTKSLKQKLQAIYLLNPLKGRGDVDMVLGGKRTAREATGLIGSKTLFGSMIGLSGMAPPENQKFLESQRPWWDKLGVFGGGAAEIERRNEQSRTRNQRELETQRPWWDKFGTFGGTAAERRRQSEQRKQQFLPTGMGGKYDFSSQRQREAQNKRRLESQRPWWDKFGVFGGATAEQRRRQQQQQQARISRSTSRSTTTTPPRPPSTRRSSGRTTTTTVRSGGNRSGGSNRNGSTTPRFSSSHGRSSGRMVSASAYGIYR